MLDQLIGESHPLNVFVTRLLLLLDPSAYGDCDRVCGFERTLGAFLGVF
jgi:hypothetical protein